MLAGGWYTGGATGVGVAGLAGGGGVGFLLTCAQVGVEIINKTKDRPHFSKKLFLVQASNIGASSEGNELATPRSREY